MRLLALACACAWVLPSAAAASYPGSNGDLVVGVTGCEENRHLVAVPWRGGDLRPVTPACEMTETDAGRDYLDITAPEISPDGLTLFARQRVSRDYSVISMAPDGGSRMATNLPAWPGSFSPDGRRFAFVDSTGAISVTSVMGGDRRRLTRACSRNCTFRDPRWSPDGHLIAAAVSHYGTGRRSRPAEGIWLIRASDGVLVRRVARHGGEVDWAPRGRRLVYATSFRRADHRYAAGGDLYVVGRDGRHRRPLVRRAGVAETSPTWSPDGRWIAWVSMRFEGRSDVYFVVRARLSRVRVRGGRPTPIRRIPSPYVDEASFDPPSAVWLPRL